MRADRVIVRACAPQWVAYFADDRLHMMLGEHDASIAALETSLTLDPNLDGLRKAGLPE